MKWTKLKTMVASSLVFGLTAQSLLSYGLTVDLPKKLVNINYPEELSNQINEVLVCIEEAEQELYSPETLKLIPKIKHKETRTCREILSTKPFANDLVFQVDYSEKSSNNATDSNDKKLTILDTPLKLDSKNPYLKDTETLEIAMRMFVELNQSLTPEILELHQENGILDALYLRLFNMSYSLPKVQGHPIFTEFTRDIRDSYFRVNGSFFFRSLVYFAYYNNPDKELNETLLRFIFHIEDAGMHIDTYTPDENQQLSSNLPDSTPEITDPDLIGWGDLNDAWDNAYADAIAEEEKEDLGNYYEISVPSVARETLKTYEVKNGVCMRITTTTENGKEIDRLSEKAPSGEIYRCGDSSLLGNEPTLSDSEEVVDALNPIVSYRYGGDEAEWVHTTLKAKEGALSYSHLSDLLMTIASEFGAGSLQESNRWLYILSGKPLYLEKYKEDWSVQEINNWLASKEIELEFGLNVEDQEAQQNFFDWLHSKEK